MARLLLDEAAAGDCVARRIVREQGMILGEYAAVAARRVGIEGTPFPLIMTGVFRHPGRELANALVARVRASSPDVCPVRSPLKPALGAVRLTLEVAGVDVDDGVRHRFAATTPAPSFFAN